MLISLQFILGKTETTALEDMPSRDTTVSMRLSKTDQEPPRLHPFALDLQGRPGTIAM